MCTIQHEISITVEVLLYFSEQEQFVTEITMVTRESVSNTFQEPGVDDIIACCYLELLHDLVTCLGLLGVRAELNSLECDDSLDRDADLAA